MRVLRRLRPSYANVISTLALFVALGGTSYAAFSLPRSSVGARELKSGSVSASEVRDGSLRARELRSGSRPARVYHARVRRGGVYGDVTLDGANGMRLSLTRGSLVNLELTDPSLQTSTSLRACAVSATAVASRVDLGPNGPENPGGTFLEANTDFHDAVAVYAFDRDGNPVVSSFDLTLACPRR